MLEDLDTSGYVREAAHRAQASTEVEARAKRAAELRGLTGDEFPAYVNMFQHVDRMGRLGKPYADEIATGEYARARAAEDVQKAEIDREQGGNVRYVYTVRLNTNHTFDILDLSGGAL